MSQRAPTPASSPPARVVVWAILILALQRSFAWPDVLGTIGSFTLHQLDVVFFLAVLYCAPKVATRWRYSPLELLNLFLCGLLVFNLARGLVMVGFAPAGVQFRDSAGLIAASLFVYFSYRDLDVDWLFDTITTLGWTIALLGLVRLGAGGNFLQLTSEASVIDPTGSIRTLSGASALMLGEAALIVLSRMALSPPGRKRRWQGITFLVFTAGLLTSQQRTATFAFLAGIVVLAVTLPARQRRIAVAVGGVMAVLGGAALFVAWIVASGDLTPYLPRAITEMSSDASTYAWRVAHWEKLLDLYEQAPLADQLIGQPLGSIRLLALNTDDTNLLLGAHSQYLSRLLYSGAVGALLFGLMMLWALIQGCLLLRERSGLNASKVGLAVTIVAAQAVYSYTYGLDDGVQGLLLAMALRSIATAHRPSRQRFPGLVGVHGRAPEAPEFGLGPASPPFTGWR